MSTSIDQMREIFSQRQIEINSSPDNLYRQIYCLINELRETEGKSNDAFKKRTESNRLHEASVKKWETIHTIKHQYSDGKFLNLKNQLLADMKKHLEAKQEAKDETDKFDEECVQIRKKIKKVKNSIEALEAHVESLKQSNSVESSPSFTPYRNAVEAKTTAEVDSDYEPSTEVDNQLTGLTFY